jgi:hypothetical protein
MNFSRTLLLFDPNATPQGWNERMVAGEYAVLYSAYSSEMVQTEGRGPFCTVFGDLAAAKAHANSMCAASPELRCRIYDEHGLGNQAVAEVCGARHRAGSELSAGFRCWCGSILFLCGLGLIALDWSTGFRLSWPATLGVRALPVGLILLLTETVIVWESRRRAARTHRTG